MRERSTKDSSFPHWVALGSLVFVLAMFFTNTVPALRERHGLADLQTQLVGLQMQFETAIEQTARQAHLGAAESDGSGNSNSPGGNFDLQSLLVAIDQHDLTPHELWQQYGGPPTDEEDREPR